MMHLLHIGRRTMRIVFLSLIGLVLLFSLFDMIEHVRVCLANAAPVIIVFDLFLLRLPTALYQMLPFAVLFGCLAVMMEMARTGEALVLHAAAQKECRGLLPFALTGLVAAVGMIAIGEWWLPPSENTTRLLMQTDVQHVEPNENLSGVRWVAGPSGVWRVGERRGDELSNVLLYPAEAVDGWGDPLEAEHLAWNGEGWSQLPEAVDGSARKLDISADAIWAKALEPPEFFDARYPTSESMTAGRLLDYLAWMPAQIPARAAYATGLGLRGSLPLLCLLFPFLAARLAWRRAMLVRGGMGRVGTVMLGLVAGLVVFALVALGKAAAEAGILFPAVGTLSVPMLVFLWVLVDRRRN